MEIVNEFKRLPLPFLPAKDTLRCTMGNSGTYSVKEGYRCLEKNISHSQQANSQRDQPSHTLTMLFTELWKIDMRPSTKLFLWKCIRGITPTTFLKKRHLPISELCCFCFGVDENLDHCFFIAPLLEHAGLALF